MAKRFVDTELWQKEWYQDLSLKDKLLVKYIFENCDCAGVWNGNLKLASFIIGEKITLEDLQRINEKKEQFEILDNDKIYVVDFIKFQYGTLSENCKPHKPVIEKLKKYGLFERVSKGYPKGIETLEEKEKEQEQYKEKEKEKLYGEYQNVFLTESKYKALESVCISDKLLNELIDSLSRAIETGKEQPYKAELPNAHYERLKSYYNYRKKNPDKFRDETTPKKTATKMYTEPAFIPMSEEEKAEADKARQKFFEVMRAKQIGKDIPV